MNRAITMEQYWMGRDAKYPAELTTEIRHNAEVTVAKVNALLAMADGVEPGVSARGDAPATRATRRSPGSPSFR